MLPFFFRGANLARQLVWSFTRPITTGVRILMVQDESFLLIEHSYRKGWFLPGGGLKRGELLSEAARREAAEETGAELKDLDLLGVYTNNLGGKTDHIVLFYSTDFTISGKSDFEIKHVGLFRPDHLPSMTSPGTRRRIEEYLHWDGIPKAQVW